MDSRQLQLVLTLNDQLSKELKKISTGIGDVEKGTGKASGMMGGFAKNIAQAAAAYFSFQAAYNSLSLGVQVAADLQTAEIGLKTLLGSADEAAATVDRLKKEAARTPFELTGLTQATQLLTAVTKDGNKSIDIILDIGEGLAAMGKGQGELDRIIVNLQQIAAVGKAATIDIKQFAFAGIPIYEMLAETTGKTGEELEKLIEDGGITFDLLTRMFDEANDSGGRFFNAYVNQAGSFNQASANMKDSFAIMMADIATSTGLFDGMTTAMMGAADTMMNYKTVLGEINTLVGDGLQKFDEQTLIITHLKGAWMQLQEVWDKQLKPAFSDLWATLVELKPFWEALGTVIGFTLVAAIHLFIAAITLMAEGFGNIIAIVTRLVDFVLFGLDSYIGYLSNVITIFSKLLSGDFAGAWTAVKDSISDLVGWFEKLIDKLEAAWDLMKEMGLSGIDKIKGAFSGRATGGSVAAGRPYMVGENGPEMFVPQGNGKIVPDYRMSGGGLAGITVNVYGDVTGEDLIDKVERGLSKRIKERVRIA